MLVFSYAVGSDRYLGQFALENPLKEPDDSPTPHLIGSKLPLRYNPQKPEIWYIPQKLIEGWEIQQRNGMDWLSHYPYPSDAWLSTSFS